LNSGTGSPLAGRQVESSRVGSLANASLVPSGLSAGNCPGVTGTGVPPASGTDSISPVQPRWTAKYTVSLADTLISSPMTPDATSCVSAVPVAEFSTSSAPALVTATIGGEPATVDADADADALAGTVTVAVGAAVPPDPPHAASSARAAGTASRRPTEVAAGIS
jgi:hypothetical protein